MLLLSLHSNVQMIVQDPELLDALLLVPQLLEDGLLVVGTAGDECCYGCQNYICESFHVRSVCELFSNDSVLRMMTARQMSPIFSESPNLKAGQPASDCIFIRSAWLKVIRQPTLRHANVAYTL
jgi:hypothetical protein